MVTRKKMTAMACPHCAEWMAYRQNEWQCTRCGRSYSEAEYWDEVARQTRRGSA